MRPAVCTITRDDPEQVRAVLAPWREIAAEVVIGYDDRVDDARRAGYALLADRVLAVRFEFLERHLAELHAACDAEWVLRLDTDEVPSAALVAAIAHLQPPAMTNAYAFPRHWVTPDAGGWIDEAPWHPGTQLRLARRTPALRFSGKLHSSFEPDGGATVLEAPLYHLDCALKARADRQRKAVLYDVLRVGQVTDGGLPMHAYYDPETYAMRRPAPLPDADRPALAAVLRAAGRPEPPADAPRDAAPAASAVSAPGAEVEVELLERDLRLFAEHPRRLLVRITNRGAAPLRSPRPGDPNPISLASRLRWADATVQEGPRTPLAEDLAPGASTVLVANVDPVGRFGDVTLELDLVEEHMRWFGAVCAAPMVVGPGYEPPVRREPPPTRGLFRRRAAASPIPRVVHRIWLGANPLPDDHVRYGETWREHHPDWEHRLWTDADVPDVPALARARNLAEQSDFLRYEILRRHGGIYLDTDVECVRPIDGLLRGVSMFAGYEVPGRLGSAVMGGVAGHPALERLCTLADDTVGRGTLPEAVGPLFLTRVVEPLGDVVLFGRERFYPYLWNESAPAAIGPETYAIHHWAKSWLPSS